MLSNLLGQKNHCQTRKDILAVNTIINLFPHWHSVWKSPKKSHSTLRAKRATFTFWVDKSSLKMPKGSILASFWKPEACGRTVLPDRSFLKGQKLMEIVKIQKFKCDIFCDFQTLCVKYSLWLKYKCVREFQDVNVIITRNLNLRDGSWWKIHECNGIFRFFKRSKILICKIRFKVLKIQLCIGILRLIDPNKKS